MNNVKNDKIILWRKVSTTSAYICGFTAIVHAFFREYIESYIDLIIIIELLCIFIFLIAQVMKLILKK